MTAFLGSGGGVEMLGMQGTSVAIGDPVAIDNDDVIATDARVARVVPEAAVTGVILAPGTTPGQQVWVVNEAVALHAIDFAAANTSHVADSDHTLAGGVARLFIWTGSLWYRAA